MNRHPISATVERRASVSSDDATALCQLCGDPQCFTTIVLRPRVQHEQPLRACQRCIREAHEMLTK